MRVEGEGYDVVCMILFKVPVALCAIFFLWQTLFVFEWGGGGVKMIQTHECNMGLKSSTLGFFSSGSAFTSRTR